MTCADYKGTPIDMVATMSTCESALTKVASIN